jgi:hypothetical protein
VLLVWVPQTSLLLAGWEHGRARKFKLGALDRAMSGQKVSFDFWDPGNIAGSCSGGTNDDETARKTKS